MKFCSYLNQQSQERLGLLVAGKTFDVAESAKNFSLSLAATMLEFLNSGETGMLSARKLENNLKETPNRGVAAVIKKNLAPIPHPPACRDGYAFREHVETMRRTRGAEMIPEFYQFPVFYFTNHNCIVGEGDVIVEKDHLNRLDYELELAAVIGKRGRNIPSSEADSYIAGFTIMNDFTCRQMAIEEMKLTMGPAKGKDFATALGPWLVTPDELSSYLIPGEFGNRYDLNMQAFHNGKLLTDGNCKTMYWTFAEIIERAAYGVELLPGEVIGSGTVGRGCYMEINSSGEADAKAQGKEFKPSWLAPGDEIELQITGLGSLKNKIVRSSSDFSIFAKKKNV